MLDLANDPYWNNVALLLHFNNESGSTNFIEETGKSVTVNGNASLVSSQSKFGGFSGYFDGVGDYLTVSDSSLALGTSDFTIECWVYPTTASRNQGIFQLSPYNTPHVINQNISLSFYFADGGIFGYIAGIGKNFTQTYTPNTWYHLALVRSSGVITFYVNGVIFDSKADTTNYTEIHLGIGGYYDLAYLFTGYIDEFRITKGLARYTANFTVPAAPFTLESYATKDSSGNLLPPTSPFTYEGTVVSNSNPIPPVEAFPNK